MIDIEISGDIGWEVRASEIRKQIPKEGQKKLRLLINSPGGYVFEAFEIYNMIKDYPGDVIAEITGMAASAAAYLTLGADEIRVHKNSTLMFHKSWNFVIGNSDELLKNAMILDKIDQISADDYAKLTGKTKEEALNEFKNEVWLIGSEKIEAAGIPVKKVDEEKDDPQTAITEASVHEKITKTINRVKQHNLNQIAASIKYNFENNKKEEGTMDFKEYITKNPEQKDAVLNYAKENLPKENKSKEDIDNAKKETSGRILELLELGGVKLSKELKEAIDSEMTTGEFAISEMKKINSMSGSNIESLGAPKIEQGLSGDNAKCTKDEIEEQRQKIRGGK